MRSKIVSKKTLFIVILVGFTLSPIFTHKSPTRSEPTILSENTFTFPTQEQKSFGLPASPVGKPVHLRIPEINVDALVKHVGLASDGTMDTPKTQGSVTWYKFGPRPGENGSAVIAGHYGVWKNGQGSVFDNLHTLRKGDKIYIEDDKGMIISFVVRESRRYDPKAEASAVFGLNDGKAHLNLITCEGVWDLVSKTYSKRLVVFTDQEIP